MEYNTNADANFQKKVVALSENNVELLDHLGVLSQEDIHCDVYAALLCINGKAVCKTGNNILEVKKCDVLLCRPNLFMENAMASMDFECRAFLMSPTLFESIFLLDNNIWDAKFILEENPVVHLNEEQTNRLLLNHDFLRSKLSLPKTGHYKEIINLLLQSMVYEFFDCIKPQLQLTPYSYSAGESILKRFMALVAENTPFHRDVKFYADKLCITSKYLSSICKENTGKPASAIIGNHAVNKIKRMLCTPNKSVKEVANEAGFDNLSFFGKYVRRELGVSPREYRLKKDI